MDIVEFGKRLRKLRKNRNYTMLQLAETTGIAKSSISLYESGDRIPNMNVVINLAKALDTTINYLVGEEKPKREALDIKQIINNIKNLSDEDLENLVNETNDFINFLINKYDI